MKNYTYTSYTQPHRRKQLEAKLFVTQGLKDLLKIVILSLLVVIGGYLKADDQSEKRDSAQVVAKSNFQAAEAYK